MEKKERMYHKESGQSQRQKRRCRFRKAFRKSFRKSAAVVMAGMLSVQLIGCQAVGKGEEQQTGEKKEPIQVSENYIDAVQESSRSMEAAAPEPVSLKVDDYDGWRKLLDENEISEEFREALKQFAFQSGSQILKQEKENANFSPLSLYYTLALTGYGAEGETAAQIQSCLGVQDSEELAAQCRKLYQYFYYKELRQQKEYKEYGAGDYKSTIQLANSLWVSPRIRLKKDYQETASRQFFASSYLADFEKEETGKQMGEWISDHTKGLLSPDLNPAPQTVLSLINTLYFYGSWLQPFQESNTREDTFTMENGNQISCPFLNQIDEQGSFQKGNGYTASFLNTDNWCRMVFLLPDQGRSVNEFLDTPEALQKALDADSQSWVSGKVTWKIPKFSFGSSMKELPEDLKAMGMERMFTDDAEFGRISDQPLLVSEVIQETHIAIDEQGVEGAAYTMMALCAGGTPSRSQEAEMILDRPFLFGIQDTAAGAWLFLGVCRNPAAE